MGVTTADVQAKVEEVLAEIDLPREEIELEWVVCLESAHSAPDEDIVELVARNARHITGQPIEINVSSGSTDARFWWLRGIPAAIYGTGMENIAVPDEYVLEAQFGQMLKVHAATSTTCAPIEGREIRCNPQAHHQTIVQREAL